MTTIIGVEHKGKVFMGADSQGTVGWSRIMITAPKIIRFPALLIGVAGDLRTLNLLQYHFSPPDPHIDMTDDEYIIVRLVTDIRECLKKNGWLKIENSKESGDYNTFLIGYHGKLYRIGSDFDVLRSQASICSVGSGSEYALGAMYALRAHHKGVFSESQIKSHIQTALQVSAQLSIGVSEPFYVESI